MAGWRWGPDLELRLLHVLPDCDGSKATEESGAMLPGNGGSELCLNYLLFAL